MNIHNFLKRSYILLPKLILYLTLKLILNLINMKLTLLICLVVIASAFHNHKKMNAHEPHACDHDEFHKDYPPQYIHKRTSV